MIDEKSEKDSINNNTNVNAYNNAKANETLKKIEKIHNYVYTNCDELKERLDKQKENLIDFIIGSDFHIENSKEYKDSLIWYRELEARYNAFTSLKNIIYELSSINR